MYCPFAICELEISSEIDEEDDEEEEEEEEDHDTSLMASKEYLPADRRTTPTSQASAVFTADPLPGASDATTPVALYTVTATSPAPPPKPPPLYTSTAT